MSLFCESFSQFVESDFASADVGVEQFAEEQDFHGYHQAFMWRMRNAGASYILINGFVRLKYSLGGANDLVYGRLARSFICCDSLSY